MTVPWLGILPTTRRSGPSIHHPFQRTHFLHPCVLPFSTGSSMDRDQRKALHTPSWHRRALTLVAVAVAPHSVRLTPASTGQSLLTIQLAHTAAALLCWGRGGCWWVHDPFLSLPPQQAVRRSRTIGLPLPFHGRVLGVSVSVCCCGHFPPPLLPKSAMYIQACRYRKRTQEERATQ